jgi:hypothetical protein
MSKFSHGVNFSGQLNPCLPRKSPQLRWHMFCFIRTLRVRLETHANPYSALYLAQASDKVASHLHFE